jgi:uncharacterized paraquat-inducible protein A
VPTGFCPDCDGRVSLHPVKVGQMLTCPYCDARIEVINDDPLEFDWAYDWDWEEEEEEVEEEE